jgi:hypothetical protein
MNPSMKWNRYLKGKVSVRYARYNKWHSVNVARYWRGRLIYFSLSKINFILDCRINWIEDMITGKPR